MLLVKLHQQIDVAIRASRAFLVGAKQRQTTNVVLCAKAPAASVASSMGMRILHLLRKLRLCSLDAGHRAEIQGSPDQLVAGKGVRPRSAAIFSLRSFLLAHPNRYS